jgi:predicted glycoside hydrolase/deacetylase ChbG (UPF0249 family)
MARLLIVNADDFGVSTGVNRGIVECHVNGIVTSTSLMVTGHAVPEAVSLSQQYPALAIGLHWDVCGEGDRALDLRDTMAVRDEFRRQFDEFCRLMGRLPTHVDSHKHLHREQLGLFEELVAPFGLPLRHNGRVRYLGGFYAQWEWKVTDLDYVGVPFLQRLLREEVPEGWTELACHPGYVSDDYHAVYLLERETEVRTLTDPRVREKLRELGIELRSFADVPRGPVSRPR